MNDTHRTPEPRLRATLTDQRVGGVLRLGDDAPEAPMRRSVLAHLAERIGPGEERDAKVPEHHADPSQDQHDEGDAR